VWLGTGPGRREGRYGCVRRTLPVGYLLRLWRMDRDSCWVWCASLQDVQSGERWTFASLQALIAFLVAICPEKPVLTATDGP
jgi:hypothetical protein